jgi:hypothetical protein
MEEVATFPALYPGCRPTQFNSGLATNCPDRCFHYFPQSILAHVDGIP